MRVTIISLIVLFAAVPARNSSATDIDGDFIAKIEQHLPAVWKVELNQRGVSVSSPPMDVVASANSAGDWGVTKRPLLIVIRLTPKYSAAMLDRVDAYNAAIEASVDPDRRSKPVVAKMLSRQIERPRYYDADYGIAFGYPSYCPAQEADCAMVRRFVAKISKEWKAYDESKKSVADDITAKLLDKS